MASLKAILGNFPNTGEYESKREALEREYHEFMEFSKSKVLKNFQTLENEVLSDDFKSSVKKIKSQQFKDTEAYRKQQECKALAKQKDIKTNINVNDSEIFAFYKKFAESDELKRYQELEVFIQSEDFIKVKTYMNLPAKKKYQQSELFKNYQHYLELKNDPEIKKYYKLVNSKAFADYKSIKGSVTETQYLELKKYIQSDEFRQQKRNLNGNDFKESKAYDKLTAYKELNKDKGIKNYLKIIKSPLYAIYIELKESSKLEAYTELNTYIHSDAFKEEKARIEHQKFSDTEEYTKEQEFIRLKKSKEIVDYFTFENSKEYKIYQDTVSSEKLKQYQKLESYLESEEFKQIEEYMALSPQKKYELSDAYKTEQEYLEAKNSEKIEWYFSLVNSPKFDEIKRWKLSFEDNFDTSTLDRKKWMTRYFWGENLLHDSYSLDHEYQFYTDGKNLEIDNSVLKIITRRESVSGKSWSPKYGFYARDFNYTSGLISTGGSFRQQYGLFEAKIKIHPKSSVTQCFWLACNQITPHIDIMKANSKVCQNLIWMNGSPKPKKKSSGMSAGKLAQDFFIYAIEWSANKIIWKINGVIIASASANIASEPMYMVVNAAIFDKKARLERNTPLEIDWVRCYQHIESK